MRAKWLQLPSQAVFLVLTARFSHQGSFPSWEKTPLHKTQGRKEREKREKLEEKTTSPLKFSHQLKSTRVEILQLLFQMGAVPAPVVSFPTRPIPSHCPARPRGGGGP